MEINYYSIIHGDSKAYPARCSTIINLAGTPFNDALSPINPKTHTHEKAPISYFLEAVLKEKEENGIDAVVFTAGEPCLQSNALLPLCRELQKNGLKVKIDTSGFYPEELKALLPNVNYVSLTIQNKLEENNYTKTLGTMQFALFYQRIVRTFAILQNASVMREVKTPVIGGLNNKKTTVEYIAKEITPFADLYVLEQWTPATDYALAAGYYPPSRQELIELAAAARNFFPKVNIRALHAIEQELIHHKR